MSSTDKVQVVVLDVGSDMPTFLKGLAQGLKESGRVIHKNWMM